MTGQFTADKNIHFTFPFFVIFSDVQNRLPWRGCQEPEAVLNGRKSVENEVSGTSFALHESVSA